MAKATRKTVIVVPEVKRDEITLKLSEDEAQALADVFWVIGGATGTVGDNPDWSRRAHTAAVSGALNGAGIQGGRGVDLEGSLFFADTNKPEEL